MENSDPSHEELRQQVQNLCRTGNKIQAIKVYRSARRVDLADAKEAVEQIVATDTNETRPTVGRSSNPDAERDLDGELLQRIERDGTIPAIKWYRDQTRCGLRQAKEHVEDLIEKTGANPQSTMGFGWIVSIVLAILAVLCVLAFFGFAA